MPCACIDTQKVHINYIKFQSLSRRFLHIKYVNLKILSHGKRVLMLSVILGKVYRPSYLKYKWRLGSRGIDLL
jgi:hypothetical protein